MVDCEDVDRLALVLETPAGAARRRVPPGHGRNTANVGEFGDFALRLPVVARDQAVGSVGAGDGGERACGLVVAGVVGDWCRILVADARLVPKCDGSRRGRTCHCGSSGGEGDDVENAGEVHLGRFEDDGRGWMMVGREVKSCLVCVRWRLGGCRGGHCLPLYVLDRGKGNHGFLLPITCGIRHRQRMTLAPVNSIATQESRS